MNHKFLWEEASSPLFFRSLKNRAQVDLRHPLLFRPLSGVDALEVELAYWQPPQLRLRGQDRVSPPRPSAVRSQLKEFASQTRARKRPGTNRP